MKSFDLYLATVKWASIDCIESYTLSKCPLEPTQLLQGRYIYDTVVYQKQGDNYLQIVVKSYSKVLLNNQEQLFNIQNTDIWLIKGEWRISEIGTKYHYCPSINSVGELLLANTHDEILIRVAPNFTDFSFEALKQDFEGELWDIITLNNSKSRIASSTVKYGDKLFRFAESKSVIDFITIFEILSRNPKTELKETTTEYPVKKVKPIPDTYKKIALLGHAKTLPSKSETHDSDIYENRFLCLMLHKINQIINYNVKYTGIQLNRLKTEIKNISNQIKSLSEEPTVNGTDILNEIKAQKHHYQIWLQKWEIEKNNVLSECNNSDCKVNMVIEIVYKSDSYDFWVNKDGEYSLMSFPVTMDKIFEEQKNQRLRITAKCIPVGVVGRLPKQYNKYKVSAIKSIDLENINYSSIIAKQETNYNTLKTNDWKLYSILNDNEKIKLIRERTNQVTTLKNRIEKINNQINSLLAFSDEISLLAPKLQNLLSGKFASKINYKRLARFQPSMTYIQNPKYRKALKAYNEILSAEGIDIAIFGYYEEILQYSIREFPQVYELWCLVSIIKILEETYTIKAQSADLKKLISSIQPGFKKLEKHVKIEFTGSLNGREVILHYQKNIENKRPDFILEISSYTNSIYLVLDAKYKNYNYKLSASEEIRLLVNKYSISSDYFVFSLHPNNDLISNERSTKLTNLGGEHIYTLDGDIELPFHRFGYLKVKPLQRDNLKKLIGMAFEYLLESDLNAKQPDYSLDPKPENDLICPICGNLKFEIKTNKTFFKGKAKLNYIYQCQNVNCQHTIYINYCWNCKTKLFKHGSYWDYHKTSVWSIFDIHCPCCGMTVADYAKS